MRIDSVQRSTVHLSDEERQKACHTLQAGSRDRLQHLTTRVVKRGRLHRRDDRHTQRPVAAALAARHGRHAGNEVGPVALHPAPEEVFQERRAVGDARDDGRLARVRDVLPVAIVEQAASRGKVPLRYVLDVDDEYAALGEIRVHRDEVSWAVHARSVVTRARDEYERSRGPVLGLCEVPRQREKHRQAVRVVTGGVEPAVRVGIEHDALIALAATNDADGVHRPES